MNLIPPDTAAARAAADLAREVSPVFMLNHLHRTYWYGRTLVRTEIDEEAAYVAAMLHDIGLTDEHRGEESFEVVGAAAAAELLATFGWEAERIAGIERAITRHVNITPNTHPVELVVQGGAAFDAIGFPPDSIPDEVIAAVEEAFPRVGFKEGVLDLFRREVEAHPNGAFAGLEESLSFSAMVKDRPEV